MTYFDELKKAMEWLGQFDDVVFIGQGIATCGGTYMSPSMQGVDENKRIECIVDETFQVGASIGMGLHEHVCISIFPRYNFLIVAMSELVNLLDKLPEISGVHPKVIIRLGVGATKPISAGCQHSSNFTEAFRLMMPNIEIVELKTKEDIMPAYQKAYEKANKGLGASILVEYGDLYYL